jgi:hypothetical protein
MTKEGVCEWYRTVMTLHTIAYVFKIHLKGYSHTLNRKNWFLAFSAKKGGVCFEVAYAPKS